VRPPGGALERPTARIAALCGFAADARRLVGCPEEALVLQARDLPLVLSDLTGVLGPRFAPVQGWAADPSKVSFANGPDTTQKWWAKEANEARCRTLADKACIRDKARLACQRGAAAYGWLRAIPSRGLHMDIRDADYVHLLRFWLGLPVVGESGDFVRCPACGEAADAYGDHFLCCAYNGMTERHNALRDCLLEECSRGGIPARAEQGCTGDTRDADLLLVGWARGRNLAVDITVRHPLAPSQWPLHLPKVRKCLREGEADKLAKAHDRCKRFGWDYAAAAFSPWGMAGPAAKGLLDNLARRVACAAAGREKQERMARLFDSVSLTVAIQVARQLRLAGRVSEAAADGASTLSPS
jgi:hypothetical protein